MFLGGLMKQCGTQSPLTIKNKSEWIALERLRWVQIFDIPMATETPDPFPQSTVNTQRALCYIATAFPAPKLAEAMDVLYDTLWVQRKTVGKPDVIAEALRSVFTQDEVKSVLEGMKGDAATKALPENTNKAFEDGAFGVPCFVATNVKGETQGFWGVYHIGQVLHFLGIERGESNGLKALL